MYQFLRAMRCLKKPKEAHWPLLLRRCTPRAPYLPPFDAPLRRHLRLTSSFSCKRPLSSTSLRYLKELFFLVNYFSLAPGKPRSVGHHHRRPKVGILPCIQVHRSWEMRRPLSLPPRLHSIYRDRAGIRRPGWRILASDIFDIMGTPVLFVPMISYVFSDTMMRKKGSCVCHGSYKMARRSRKGRRADGICPPPRTTDVYQRGRGTQYYCV